MTKIKQTVFTPLSLSKITLEQQEEKSKHTDTCDSNPRAGGRGPEGVAAGRAETSVSVLEGQVLLGPEARGEQSPQRPKGKASPELLEGWDTGDGRERACNCLLHTPGATSRGPVGDSWRAGNSIHVVAMSKKSLCQDDEARERHVSHPNSSASITGDQEMSTTAESGDSNLCTLLRNMEKILEETARRLRSSCFWERGHGVGEIKE